MYTFKEYPLDFIEIKKKFQNLNLINKNFFYDTDWLKSLEVNNNKNHKYIYVEVYYQNKILMIMFFQLKFRFSLKILNWLHMEELNFVTPFIVQKHDFKREEFLNLLKKIFNNFKADIIFLDKNPKYIDEILNPLSFYKNTFSEKIPIINLGNNTWNRYYENIANSKTRQTDRRKEKLLSQKGNLEFIIAETLNDKEDIFKFTLKNKLLFLKKRGHETKKFEKIYTQLFDLIKNDPNYICSMLKFNDQIISSIISRLEKKNLYYLLPCTLEKDFLQYSPGRIILKKQIEWCFENEINKIDLGPGEFKYKNQWANGVDNYFKIVEPKSFLGNIYFLLYKLKNIFN